MAERRFEEVLVGTKLGIVSVHLPSTSAVVGATKALVDSQVTTTNEQAVDQNEVVKEMTVIMALASMAMLDLNVSI